MVYINSPDLADYLLGDVKTRFGFIPQQTFAHDLAKKTGELVRSITNTHNLAQF